MSASSVRTKFNNLIRRRPRNGQEAYLNNARSQQNEHTSLLNHAQSHIHNILPTNNNNNSNTSPSSWPKRFIQTTWSILRSNYINVLLIFVPIGLISGVAELPAMATFCLNFLAIIPLAALLSFATEELAATVGPSVGGLLNATFGNAIELIVSVIALMKDEFRLVQASILGSVLVNILLVLGCCFIAGGIGQGASRYDPTVASVMSSLQTLASSALIVPAVLYSTLRNSADGDTVEILDVSRATAVILIALYIVYLVFQLKTHSNLFSDDDPDDDEDADTAAQEAAPDYAQAKATEQEEHTLGPQGALTCMVISVILVGFCAEFLVDSIEDVVESTPITKTFMGLILLPIVSNAAEHVTAVVVSYKGKMNLALLVDLGSGLQIALFVTPLLVLLAWAMDKPLSLHFQLFETIVFFLSVLVVNFLIRGGEANYLEGCMCVGWYCIIAVAIFYYPDGGSPVGLGWDA